MKIVICASTAFSDKILEVEGELKKMGHDISIPYFSNLFKEKKLDFEKYKKDKEKEGDTKYRQEYRDQVDLVKRYYKLIGESDAVLVLNCKKNEIENYIGGSVLMEMGFAYVLDKKIYLLNDIPKMQYIDEIIAAKPVVIHGDLSKIK